MIHTFYPDLRYNKSYIVHEDRYQCSLKKLQRVKSLSNLQIFSANIVHIHCGFPSNPLLTDNSFISEKIVALPSKRETVQTIRLLQILQNLQRHQGGPWTWFRR